MNNPVICPLMSAGQEIPLNCIDEACAWYYKSYKACSIFILAHNGALEIKQKQNEASKG